MAEEHGVGDSEAWAAALTASKDAEPLVGTLMDAVVPLAPLPLFVQHCGSVARVREYVQSQRARLRTALVANGLGAYDEERALAIHAYTAEHDAAQRHVCLYRVINGVMRDSTSRAAGPGGMSAEMRACLPYIKLLWVALESLPPELHFTGKAYRGIKWAFPTPAHHDPESYFFRSRQFYWYEFKSASTEYRVMYDEFFAGASGPRTVFRVEGVKCFRIKIFSALAAEEEALFLPLTRFEVQDSQKKLEPCHLAADAPPGGHPDEVHLVAPGALAEAVPKELKLKPGLEVIDFDAPPLGHGGFADVRPGTYAFGGAGSAPTTVAFKIFRGSQTLPKAMVDMVLKEARLGVSAARDVPCLQLPCPVSCLCLSTVSCFH